jgi:integrase
MPRPSKPWWWAARGRWAATVDGRRHVAPDWIKKGNEHAAWEWHADLLRGSARISTGEVQGVFEAYLEWDEARVEREGRDRASHQSRCSTSQKVCDTLVAGRRFGDLATAAVRPDHVDGLVAEWTRAGLSPGYRRSLVAILKSVFAWASRPSEGKEPLIAASPFAGTSLPQVPPVAERFATRDEAAAWLRWLWRKGHCEMALLQRCLIHTGARPSELTRATWREVRWDGAATSDGRRVAVLRRESWKNSRKTGKARRVLIPGRLHRALKRRAASASPSDLMFRTPTGLQWSPSNLACAMRDRRLEAMADGVAVLDSGPDRMTCYRWRHTAASSLLMDGVAVAVVAELLGTSPTYITRTYGHILSGHLADAAAKLASRRS